MPVEVGVSSVFLYLLGWEGEAADIWILLNVEGIQNLKENEEKNPLRKVTLNSQKDFFFFMFYEEFSGKNLQKTTDFSIELGL